MKDSLPERIRLSRLLMLGALIASQLILSRFQIGSHTLKIDFTFITMFLMGKWFGAVWSAVACGLADVISATIVNGGPFFIGFTLSAVLSGLLMGWFFYRRPVSWIRVIICQLLIAVLVNLVLNTTWVVILTQLPLRVVIIPRLVKELIETPIQIIVIYELGNCRGVRQITKRFFTDN